LAKAEFETRQTQITDMIIWLLVYHHTTHVAALQKDSKQVAAFCSWVVRSWLRARDLAYVQ
jgi:hypothetical protein